MTQHIDIENKKPALDILFEDNDCLFINKPAGISVHGDGKTEEKSLGNLLLEKYPELKDVGEPLVTQYKGMEITIPKPGIVHRLDKETSGVLLIAKNQEAHAFFKQQFQDREIQKIYHTFVYGWPKEDAFTVNASIGRESSNIRRWTTGRGTRGERREALTEFTVLSRFGNRPYEGKGSTDDGTYSFIEARPKTGRTHQIRVHLRSVNHAIVADSLYATKRGKVLGFDRLALHAYSLTVTLPNGTKETVTAPYPADFEAAKAQI